MRNRKGFTLIELLVVIAIIAVLAAILFPIFARAKAAAQQATCTQNLAQIGKSLRMYASDNDDTLPTNRNSTNVLAVQCQLADPLPPYAVKTANYVEGLAPYLEKLEDARGRETIWRCPGASNATFPAVAPAQLRDAATVTYVLSFYLAEQTEGRIDDAVNTLLMRETDRKHNALLRPYPTSLTAALNAANNPPVNCFPPQDGQGANYAFPGQTTPATLVKLAPVRHSEGSMVMFVDGHVSYRANSMLTFAAQLDNARPVGVATNRWFIGSAPDSPTRVWISL